MRHTIYARIEPFGNDVEKGWEERAAGLEFTVEFFGSPARVKEIMSAAPVNSRAEWGCLRLKNVSEGGKPTRTRFDKTISFFSIEDAYNFLARQGFRAVTSEFFMFR